MKTVLFVDSSGQQYFQYIAGVWRLVSEPNAQDTLWVLVNLPTESLEVIDLPRISGRDRSNFLQRRLNSLYPESGYRGAYILPGGMLKTGKVMLAGFNAVKDIAVVPGGHAAIFVGLWGAAAVLGLMARKFVPSDVLLVLPSALGLRILAIKGRVPVFTRYVFCEGLNNVNEILLTRNYLEDQQIFESGKTPPVLFLGDSSSVEATLVNGGLTLLPTPKEFLPKGEVGWLHPLFNFITSSPPGQLAPLTSRARYYAMKLRRVAYLAALVSLVGVSLYGQGDWRGLVEMQLRERTLHSETKVASSERERLKKQIIAIGADPELVRQATDFAEQEITAAPAVETFFSLASAAIIGLPNVRVKSLAFHLDPGRESFCKDRSAQSGLYQMGSVPPINSAGGAAANSSRQAEVELAVMWPADLSLRAKAEARKRISASLQGEAGVTILQDPTTAARSATLRGGAGGSVDQAEDLWCLGVAWKQPEKTDGKEGL
ncbi:MAG: hypothetical protein PHI06_08590 [Desulfobulbaceae bacterium]|nr:hypothetical protein [Desulfobulbaceae bacterium]